MQCRASYPRLRNAKLARMKPAAAKPALAALLAAKKRRMPAGKVQPAPHAPRTPRNNTALDAQNRRVLAQHYRAKYGVK
jgi:hypothetical protein